MTKILICGGQDFIDYYKFSKAIHEILDRIQGPVTIISGGAKGADSLAIRWANESGSKLVVFPANWDRDGKAAGFIRNKKMLKEGKPDLVVAFPGGKGTANMLLISSRAGVPIVKPLDKG